MKCTRAFLSSILMALLLHTSVQGPLWAMMNNQTADEEKEPSHRTLSRQTTDDIAGMTTTMNSLGLTPLSHSESMLPSKENKQDQPLSRKKQLKQLALQGDKEAQYALGVMFRDGDDVFKDPLKAVKWLELSSKQGHINAMNAISQMYLEGTDIDQDYKLALKWIKKLIEVGNAEGQYRAGSLYRNGWGVKKDEVEAIKWYQKSANQGYEPAQKALGLKTSKEEMKGDFDKAKTEEKYSPPSHTSRGVNINPTQSVSSPVVSDIMIPEIAKGFEDIYKRFLKGVLVYRPNEGSDVGKIELPIAALTNPLGSTFDLSRCGDTGQYLSIATGYRKGKISSKSNKVEVWLAPQFLIEKELNGTASHFSPIMSSWDAKTAPIGMFFTWGGWDNLGWYDYLTTESMVEIGTENLLKKYQKSLRCLPPTTMHGALAGGGGLGLLAFLHHIHQKFHILFLN